MPLTEKEQLYYRAPGARSVPVVGPSRNLLYRALLSIDDGDRFLWMPMARAVARWLGWGCRSRYQLPWADRFYASCLNKPEITTCYRVLGHQHGQHIDGKGNGWDSGCAGELQATQQKEAANA